MFLQEEKSNAYVLLVGYTPSLDADARLRCVALFTVRGVVLSVFGYPNEEAYWRDPRGEIGHGVVEIVGSKWTDEINSYNERTFGTALLVQPMRRHLFFGSKGASVQFLAREVDIDLFDEQPVALAFERARQEALTRLDMEPDRYRQSIADAAAELGRLVPPPEPAEQEPQDGVGGTRSNGDDAP